MRFFGPSQWDIWKLLSEDIDGEFKLRGTFIDSYKVVKEFNGHTIILEPYSGGERNSIGYTRVYCEFKSGHDFKFKMFDEYFNNYFSNLFDMDDIEPSDADYENYIIRSNSKLIANTLLDNQDFKSLVMMQDRFLFEVKNNPAYYDSSTTEIDCIIDIRILGIIKNNELLKCLFELVALTLTEIEKIFSEVNVEELDINSFNKLDVIKNSVKSVISEGLSKANLKNKLSQGIEAIKEVATLDKIENTEEESSQEIKKSDNTIEHNNNLDTNSEKKKEDIEDDILSETDKTTTNNSKNSDVDEDSSNKSFENDNLENNHNSDTNNDVNADETDTYNDNNDDDTNNDVYNDNDPWDIDTSMLEVDVSKLSIDTDDLEKRLNGDEDTDENKEKKD